jgi:hypothetical protein
VLWITWGRDWRAGATPGPWWVTSRRLRRRRHGAAARLDCTSAPGAGARRSARCPRASSSTRCCSGSGGETASPSRPARGNHRGVRLALQRACVATVGVPARSQPGTEIAVTLAASDPRPGAPSDVVVGIGLDVGAYFLEALAGERVHRWSRPAGERAAVRTAARPSAKDRPGRKEWIAAAGAVASPVFLAVGDPNDGHGRRPRSTG